MDAVGLSSYNLPIPAPTLDASKAQEYANMVDAVGAPVVACFLSSAWANRNAAVVEVTRQLMKTCGLALPPPSSTTPPIAADGEGAPEGDGTPIAAGSAKVLVQLGTLVERGLWDSVAAVYQSTLALLIVMAQHYLPKVTGRQFIVRDALQPAIRGIVNRLGDSKTHLREASETTLLTLAGCPCVPADMVYEVLAQDLVDGPASMVSTAVLGRLATVRTLVDMYGVKLASGTTPREATGELDVTDLMAAMKKLIEAKQLDVRNEAIDLFAAVYEATVVAYGYPRARQFEDHVKGLRPTLKSLVDGAIRDILRDHAVEPGASPTASSPAAASI